jgi:hypothetical protein
MANKLEKFLEDDEKLIIRLHEWLLESETSTPMKKYREDSMEDYRFYAGDQDTDEVKSTLEELKRPCTVYNEVKPKVDMLVGMAAQLKSAPMPMPASDEDVAFAELVTGAYEHVRNELRSARVELNCFEHMIKGGLDYQHFWIDTENPFKPKIRTAHVPARDCWIDPLSTEYDMSDARYFFRDKWISEDEVKARYPHVPTDQMRVVGSSQLHYPKYFDLTTDKYRIVEVWFRYLEEVFWFINPLTEKEEWLRPAQFKKFEKALREGVEIAPGQVFQLPEDQSLDSVKRFKKNIYYAIYTGDTLLEKGASTFRFDRFPYVPYGAYYDEDNNRWFGAIAMMKDPQRNLNTMRRQLTHLLQTAPRGILMHEVGSILNIEDYETRGADPTFHMEIAQGHLDKVKFSNQPQINPIYQYLDGMNSQGMKDASGIQDSLMGVQTTSREAGVSVQMRQESNIAVLHILFSNYSESRRMAAEITLSLMQQYMTEPDVIRIEGQNGMELLQINTQTNPQNEGFNDISSMKFDIVLEENIESVSTRLANMRVLADYAVANPGTIPPDVMMEYSNLPLKVQRRVLDFFEQQRERELQLQLAELNAKTQNRGGNDG